SGKKVVKIPGTLVPWLEPNQEGTDFAVREPIADVVRRIFDYAIQGYGCNWITKQLNSDGTPTFGRAKTWSHSYVSTILANRVVIGHFQPCQAGENGARKKPVGDVIEDYYPAIVDRETFDAVQAGL